MTDTADDQSTHPRFCRCAPCRAERHRYVEDRALYVALAIAALYGVGEFLIDVGLVDPPATRRIPWVTLVLCFLCVAPKMIGRATTGRAWLTLAGGLAKRLSGKSDTPS